MPTLSNSPFKAIGSHAVPAADVARVKAKAELLLPEMNKINGKQQAIREKAEEFEAMFLGQMLKHMFETVEKNEAFHGGHAEEVYESLITDEYAKHIAKRGGIGIANHVERQLLQLQEAAQ